MGDSTPPHPIHRLAARGGAVTLGAQILRLGLRLVATVALARLLLPEDFGLFAMALAFTGVLAVFRDAGLAQATIARAELTRAEVNTLFWTNLAAGLALTAVGALLAPFVAWLFGEPRLVSLTVACACVYLVSSPSVQHMALLRREMRFAAVAGIEVTGVAVTFVVAVWAAYAGAGYWALVIGQLAGAAMLSAGSWQLCAFRPRLEFDAAGARSSYAFAANVMLYSLLGAVARRFDNILIGWSAGSHALGLYSRAYQLLVFPMQQSVTPMTAVALPTLSRLHHDPSTYRRTVLRLVGIVAWLSMPMVAILFAVAEPLVVVVLGAAWRPASTLFSALAAAAFVQPLMSSLGVVYQSRGQTRRLRNWGALAALLQCLAFLAGLPWGALGVATAYSVVNVGLLLPALRHALAGTGIGVSDAACHFWRPCLASVVVGTCTRLALDSLPAATPLSALLGGLALALVLSLVLLAVWPRLRAEAISILSLVRRLLQRRPDGE